MGIQSPDKDYLVLCGILEITKPPETLGTQYANFTRSGASLSPGSAEKCALCPLVVALFAYSINLALLSPGIYPFVSAPAWPLGGPSWRMTIGLLLLIVIVVDMPRFWR